MFVVSRFEVKEGLEQEFEKELTAVLERLMPKYAGVSVNDDDSEFDKASVRTSVFSTYITEAPTNYLDLVDEIAEDSDGIEDLVQLALDELKMDVLERVRSTDERLL